MDVEQTDPVELTPERRESLHEDIRTAAHVREMFRSEGMIRMRAKIDALSGKSHSRWLTATKEEADKIRAEAYGYEMFFDLAKRVMLSGEMAKQILDRSRAE